MAEEFSREILHLHGLPRSIVSDRDRIFTSTFCAELFEARGTAPKHNTAYHPQMDGWTEVVDMCPESYLRCFASNRPQAWS